MQCNECTSYEHQTADCPSLDRCNNCYDYKHFEENCPLPPQMRCSNCQRANTVTEYCDCQPWTIFKKMQGLRLVGDSKDVAPIVDVTIYSQKYAALISTASNKTFISNKVAIDYDECQNLDHIELFNAQNNRVALQLHICIHHRLILHTCNIRQVKMPYDVILGMDFLCKYGFSLRIGKYIINNHSPRFSTDDEVRYWKKVTTKHGKAVQEPNAKFVELPEEQDHEDQDDLLELHPSPAELELWE